MEIFHTRSGIRLLMLLALCVLALPSSAQNALTGTYSLQGAKGEITVMLQQAGDGKVTGSMKGGDLTLSLQGFPRQTGGVLGTARTEGGQMMSYFQAVREGATLQFDFIGVGTGGDPDYNQLNKFTFQLVGGEAPAAPSPSKTNPDKTAIPASVPDFSGHWSGNGLTMESRKQGNDYVGTLTLNGQKMPFTSSAVSGVLHGAFSVGADRFDFQARVTNGSLVLESEGTTYRLTKPAAARNPLAAPKPSAKNPLAQKPVAKPATPSALPKSPTGGMATPFPSTNSLSGWKTYSNAMGLSVKYPPTWTVKEQNGAAVLTPGDVRQVGGGPAEIFLMTADGANGVTSADDPQVEAYIDNFIATTFPGFSRKGAIQKITVGNQGGILLEWDGATQGSPARIQVLTTIVKNYAVSMVAISLKSDIKASRDQTVLQIFTSLAGGTAQKDPQLVGKWWLYEYKGTGTTGRETKSYLTILADGTVLLSENSEFSFQSEGRNQLGDQTWAGGSNSQSQGGRRGSWAASNGRVIVTWTDGTVESWAYRVGQAATNRRLFLTGANQKTDEWMER